MLTHPPRLLLAFSVYQKLHSCLLFSKTSFTRRKPKNSAPPPQSLSIIAFTAPRAKVANLTSQTTRGLKRSCDPRGTNRGASHHSSALLRKHTKLPALEGSGYLTLRSCLKKRTTKYPWDKAPSSNPKLTGLQQAEGTRRREAGRLCAAFSSTAAMPGAKGPLTNQKLTPTYCTAGTPMHSKF